MPSEAHRERQTEREEVVKRKSRGPGSLTVSAVLVIRSESQRRRSLRSNLPHWPLQAQVFSRGLRVDWRIFRRGVEGEGRERKRHVHKTELEKGHDNQRIN